MKTIIAGSRTINDYNLLLEAISSCIITEVFSGNAFGIDRILIYHFIKNRISKFS